MANILVIGGGGREHALCWKLAQSDQVDQVFCMPGNAGTAACAINTDWCGDDPAAIARLLTDRAINLVVIGPEIPLVTGIADSVRLAGVACVGPSAAAAQLEASKAFTKQICAKAGIPTAASVLCRTEAEAREILAQWGLPLVFKVDGLAAGKGVMVCHIQAEAEAAIAALWQDNRFGAAADQVVIEECLFGQEASLFVLCDGAFALPLGMVRDHKRIGEGDTGANTGGMGCFTPIGDDSAFIDQAMQSIIRPSLAQMQAEGTPFFGVLFAGLMLTDQGPRLIEYNVRLGDPECQALMCRLQSDLYPLLLASAEGRLADCPVPQWSDQVVVNIVLAATGYPDDYARDYPLPETRDGDGITMFHAGTRRGEDGALLSHGGRVINVCACGKDLTQARERAYTHIAAYGWQAGYYRRDIGIVA